MGRDIHILNKREALSCKYFFCNAHKLSPENIFSCKLYNDFSVISVKKLQPYGQAMAITVPTNHLFLKSPEGLY